jgi:hypothetical protein
MAGPLDVFSKLGPAAVKLVAKSTARPAQEQAIDPLAQLIAARMAGQIEAIPRVGGLESLRGVNLPAAYAGDQRSLQAAQRAINKAETGLESPGRRKILKQGAAAAARQVVPEAVDIALGAAGRGAIKNITTEPVIPDESIQAAISAALNSVMKSKLYRGAGYDYFWDLEDVAPGMANKMEKLLDRLTVPEISKTYGLPEDAVQSYINKVGISPEDLLGNWADSRNSLESFLNSTDKHRFFDYGFDDLGATEDDIAKAVSRGRAGVGSEYETGYEPLYDLYANIQRERNVGPYEKLLGEKGFRDLRLKQGDVFGDPIDHFEQMYDAILDDDRLHEWLEEVYNSQVK